MTMEGFYVEMLSLTTTLGQLTNLNGSLSDIDKILGHQWVNQNDLEFQICWTLGDITWEPLAECKELEALDEYLDLCSVKQPCDLPCKTQ